MNRQVVATGLIGVGLTLVIITGFVLFGGEPQKSPKLDPRDIESVSNSGSEFDGFFAMEESEKKNMERTEVSSERAVSIPEEGEAPESYRVALSGIRGRILLHDLVPLAGVTVSLLELDLDSVFSDWESVFRSDTTPGPEVILGEAVTKEDGTFRLEGAHARRGHGLGIDLGGPRGTLRVIDQGLHAGELTDLGDIILGESVALFGRIVDENGTPIENARVRSIPIPPMFAEFGIEHLRHDSILMITQSSARGAFDLPNWMARYEKRLPFPTDHTDSDGTFRLDGVSPGLATLIINHEDRPSLVKSPVPTGRSPERDVGSITMTPGRSIRGRVLNEAGEAVPGMRVVAGVEVFAGNLGLGRDIGESDASGHFAVSGIPDKGKLCVAANSGPGLPWHFCEDSSNPEQLEIRVPTSHSITLSLIDEDDQVVQNALVKWRELPGGEDDVPPTIIPFRTLPSKKVTVAQGQIKIEDVPKGDYGFIAAANGYAWTYVKVKVKDQSQEATLLFRPSLQAEVKVFDVSTKEPISYAEVSVRVDDEAPALSMTRTDKNGVATLRGLPAKPRVGQETTRSTKEIGPGLDLTESRLFVRHPSYAPFSTPFLGDPVTECPLEGGAQIKGFVLERGAVPTSPYMVVVLTRGDGRRIDPAASMPFIAITGPDGSFQISGLPVGEVNYGVYRRFLNQDAGSLIVTSWESSGEDFDEVADGELTLHAGQNETLIDIAPTDEHLFATIQGILRVNQKKPTEFKISVDGDEMRREKSAVPNEDGTFRIEGIPPGKVSINVHTNDAWSSFSYLYKQELDLQASELRPIDIRVEVIRILFEVVSESGAKIEDAVVSVSNYSSESEEMGGTFISTWNGNLYEGLVPRGGSYDVQAYRNDGGSFTVKTIMISDAGMSAPMRLVFKDTVSLSGQCFAPSGELIDEGYFSMASVGDSEGAEIYQSHGMIEDGRFEVHAVVPGEFKATYYGEPGATAIVSVPAGGSKNAEIHFQVKVDDSDGGR